MLIVTNIQERRIISFYIYTFPFYSVALQYNVSSRLFFCDSNHDHCNAFHFSTLTILRIFHLPLFKHHVIVFFFYAMHLSPFKTGNRGFRIVTRDKSDVKMLTLENSIRPNICTKLTKLILMIEFDLWNLQNL